MQGFKPEEIYELKSLLIEKLQHSRGNYLPLQSKSQHQQKPKGAELLPTWLEALIAVAMLGDEGIAQQKEQRKELRSFTVTL